MIIIFRHVESRAVGGDGDAYRLVEARGGARAIGKRGRARAGARASFLSFGEIGDLVSVLRLLGYETCQ